MRLSLIAWMGAALLWTGCGQSSAKCGPGEKGCQCVAQSCNQGLSCFAGLCQEVQLTGLSVSAEEARGCEVLLRETGGQIGRVVFAGDVTGKWLRQGDKVAAAFVANQDGRISDGAVHVAYAGSGANEAFEIMRSHCYGQRGEELAGAAVTR